MNAHDLGVHRVSHHCAATSASTSGAGATAPDVEAFLYDGDQISVSVDRAGGTTHRYLYGPQIDFVLADESAALLREFFGRLRREDDPPAGPADRHGEVGVLGEGRAGEPADVGDRLPGKIDQLQAHRGMAFHRAQEVRHRHAADGFAVLARVT